MNYLTFNQFFSNSEGLYIRFKDKFNNKPAELFNDVNWFIPLTNIFIIIFNIFSAKTYNKYFIWEKNEKNELSIAIEGLFMPQLFDSLYNFYKSQLVLLNNDINELKSWDNRGSQAVGTLKSANTSYSQSDKVGWEWQDDVDAPTLKNIGNNSTTTFNRLDDLIDHVRYEFEIYWNRIFFKFEKFFINANFVDKYSGRS